MSSARAILLLPYVLLRGLARRILSLVAAASAATLVFLATTLLLVTLNTATLLSGTVFGLLSGAAERVFGDSLSKRQTVQAGRLQEENTRLRKDISSRDRALARSRATNKRLEGDLRGSRTESGRLRKQVEARRMAGRKLARRIKIRTANIASVNISSIMGEAIPLIGISVIVAATGYELAATCQTMRDMDELTALLDGGAGESGETAKVCGLEVPDPEVVWRTVAQSPSAAWQGAQDAWTETASRLPDGLPSIRAPASQEAVLESLERFRLWIWTYLDNPWTGPAQ